LPLPGGQALRHRVQRKGKNAPPVSCVLDAFRIGNVGHRPGERWHRHRASWPEHRDQPAGLSRHGPGARLPGLLRATPEFEFLLLRWHVLGVPGATTGMQAPGNNGPWGMVGRSLCRCSCCVSRSANYRSPPPYFYGCSRWPATLGRALGPRMGATAKWMGPLEPQLCARARTASGLPAPVFRRSYPQHQQQQQIHNQNYRYQQRDDDVRQRYQEESRQRGPAPSTRGQPGASQERYPVQQEGQRCQPATADPAGPTRPAGAKGR
jgi:hypothetical protein